MELMQLVQALSKSKSELLPVTDGAGSLLGEIDLNKLRHIVFRTELYHHFKVSQLMTKPQKMLRLTDSMEDVMKTFDESGAEHLAVIQNDGQLYGYISRARLYSQYRQMVADLSND